mmetsp:Transcript_31484/g.91003  ORF Transcript_31484/g.91003 Transcript_31484/m.91003 type:complete len:289 (-) Transcript_31484:150-1016(-)
MGACGLTPLLSGGLPEPYVQGLKDKQKSQNAPWSRRDQVRDQLGYCGAVAPVALPLVSEVVVVAAAASSAQQSFAPTTSRLAPGSLLGLTPSSSSRGTSTTPRSAPQGTPRWDQYKAPTLLDTTMTTKMSQLQFDQYHLPKPQGTPPTRADSAGPLLTPRMRKLASILGVDQNKLDQTPQKRRRQPTPEEDDVAHMVEAHTPRVPLSALKGSRARRHTSLSASPASLGSSIRGLDVGEFLGSLTGSLLGDWTGRSTSTSRRKRVSFGFVEQLEFEMPQKTRARLTSRF